MKTFFTIFVLLGVLGFAALNLSVIGAIVYVLGVAAAIIALLIALYDRQQRIEEKLDKLLAVREDEGKESVGEEIPAGGEEPEDTE